MNIKKNILSLAIIAGLGFSCVPQAQAQTQTNQTQINVGYAGGSFFLTTAALLALFTKVIQPSIMSPGNQVLAAATLLGIASTAFGEWYNKSVHESKGEIAFGMGVGCCFSGFGMLFAIADQMALHK